MFGNITLSKIMNAVMIYDLQEHRYFSIFSTFYIHLKKKWPLGQIHKDVYRKLSKGGIMLQYF